MTVPELLMAAVDRPLWKKVSVASAFISTPYHYKSQGDDDLRLKIIFSGSLSIIH